MAKCTTKKAKEQAVEERSLSQEEIDDLFQAISGKENRYDTILDQSDIDELVNIAAKVRAAETPKGTKKEALEYEMDSVLGKRPAKVRRFNFAKPEFLSRSALTEISKTIGKSFDIVTDTLADELDKKLTASVSQVSVITHEDFVKQASKFSYSGAYLFEGKNTAALEITADGASCNTLILDKPSKSRRAFDTKAIKVGFLDLICETICTELYRKAKGPGVSIVNTYSKEDPTLLDGEGNSEGMGCLVAVYLEQQAKGKKTDGIIVNIWLGKNLLDCFVENGVKLGGYDGSYADVTFNSKVETNAFISVGRLAIEKGEKFEKGKVFELNSTPGTYVEVVKGSKTLARGELVILANSDSDNKLGVRIME